MMKSAPINRQHTYASGRTYAITRIALLTALVSVGRLSFSFLPNVQPMTVMLVCITLYFGWRNGLAVSLLSVLVTNMTLGMGPWTFAQMAGYSVLVLLTALIEETHEAIPMPVLQVYAAFLGILYGLVVSLVQAPIFGWNIFVPYYLSGIGYDFLHAFGNLAFMPLLYPVCMRVFRLTDKSSVRHYNGKKIKGEMYE